ncbi:hypothetical protein [Sphingomonas abaci]|uniref:Uncharacterized protein n=1 Tax=Sphingomonas abaci TaxID=237611 RepID=A0A7W7AL81_9SPHN|nr:hypothetical protein [Sphingomonas abaci]MBB4619123.1 hypothetical protein [Sphingomonas abaci]
MQHDTIQPPRAALVPSILIELHEGRWRATAVIAEDAEPIGVVGPSSATARSPAAALDELLGRHFALDVGDELPASLIAINRAVFAAFDGRGAS